MPAIDQALDAFEHAYERYPVRDRRWMLEHALLLMPDHYQQIRELGVIVNSHYVHNYQMAQLNLEAWERPMADIMPRYREWVDNGIMFVNGADGPIFYYAEPILYIYGSMTRNTSWGGSLGPDQRISREDAIRSVTINSAYTSFEENARGPSNRASTPTSWFYLMTSSRSMPARSRTSRSLPLCMADVRYMDRLHRSWMEIHHKA